MTFLDFFDKLVSWFKPQRITQNYSDKPKVPPLPINEPKKSKFQQRLDDMVKETKKLESQTIRTRGRTIVINNGRVIIDGVNQDANAKNIYIVVEGDADSIEADTCNTITVRGSSGSIETTNGDVTVEGNVNSYVKTTNGDVKCWMVAGNVKTTNGDIDKRFKKRNL